jgi:hypothetical protein
MARFSGEVGYGTTVESPVGSGVWVDQITEILYFGDVERVIRRNPESKTLHPDLAVNNSISIVADEYANQHFFKIKYVRWAGVNWTVTSVEVRSPRLILSLGSVYNGPTA